MHHKMCKISVCYGLYYSVLSLKGYLLVEFLVAMLALVQELPLVFVLTVLPLTIQSISQATNLLYYRIFKNSQTFQQNYRIEFQAGLQGIRTINLIRTSPPPPPPTLLYLCYTTKGES
jgi:hypothetical protein